MVSIDDVDEIYNSKWVCEVQGEPASVVSDVDGVLHLDYIGHNGIRAEEVGFRILERFVAVGSFTLDQVDNLREVRKRLPPWGPYNEEARLAVSIESLPDLLEVIGIGEDDVSIGVATENRWCIVKNPGDAWYVFYRENGGDYGKVREKAEEDACCALIGKMVVLGYDRIARASEPVGDEVVAGGLDGALAGFVGEADAKVGDGEGGAVAGAGVLGFGAEEVGAEQDGGHHENGAGGEG